MKTTTPPPPTATTTITITPTNNNNDDDDANNQRLQQRPPQSPRPTTRQRDQENSFRSPPLHLFPRFPGPALEAARPHHTRHIVTVVTNQAERKRLTTSRLSPYPSTRVPTLAGACRGGSTGGPGRRAPSRTSHTPPCSCWGRAAVEQGVQMQAYTHPIHSLPGRGIRSLPRARCHDAHGPSWCQHSPPPLGAKPFLRHGTDPSAPSSGLSPHSPLDAPSRHTL